MFWGAFCADCKFQLCFIEGRMDSKLYCEILKDNLLRIAMKRFGKNFSILHDNSPNHTSKYTKKWIEKNIPPYTPEVNPIENLWRSIKRKVEGRKHQNLQ